MAEITDEIIILHKVTSIEEMTIIDEYCKEYDYKKYVGNSNLNETKCYIIKYDNSPIGFCGYSIKSVNDQIITYPYIYIKNKIANLSISSMFKLISHIFNEEKCDKILFTVYSNNKNMIGILKKFQIKCEGIFKKSVIIEDTLLDKYIYSILFSEFEKYKNLVDNFIWKKYSF
ncbi:hypothetical protein GCM10023142_36800 [Anaerocolumna aminovalerica]|uniref:N-acetyltransferase domain-containing protein n=1 Tax=Anaerocolumna aminovalerica TaxID=1527 RepID=A0A1I5CTL0_9FIRM|nr:GNAT family protein [Anaerocolumna aminovalerica]SFN90319.1 hypothetical protein SAMN04489757_1043 [Anaerocolumna aminovalerica]